MGSFSAYARPLRRRRLMVGWGTVGYLAALTFLDFLGEAPVLEGTGVAICSVGLALNGRSFVL